MIPCRAPPRPPPPPPAPIGIVITLVMPFARVTGMCSLAGLHSGSGRYHQNRPKAARLRRSETLEISLQPPRSGRTIPSLRLFRRLFLLNQSCLFGLLFGSFSEIAIAIEILLPIDVYLHD